MYFIKPCNITLKVSGLRIIGLAEIIKRGNKLRHFCDDLYPTDFTALNVNAASYDIAMNFYDLGYYAGYMRACGKSNSPRIIRHNNKPLKRLHRQPANINN